MKDGWFLADLETKMATYISHFSQEIGKQKLKGVENVTITQVGFQFGAFYYNKHYENKYIHMDFIEITL